jgi:hypothetical protein
MLAQKKNYIAISWSKLAIIIGVLTTIYIAVDISFWRNDTKIIENDVVSYYGYLPSVFIFSDPSLSYVGEAPAGVKIWSRHIPGEGKVIKMTMGTSICYIPFFAFAHNFALYSDRYEAQGFSMPYRLAIASAAIFYLAISLIFIRKLLLKYFSETVVFWCILAVAIGTNVLTYSITEPGMAHVYSMALISVSLYLYDRWLTYDKNKDLLFLGFLMGLICLIRPTNVIVVLFLLLYKIGNFNDLKVRFRRIGDRIKYFLIAILIAFLVILPQLLSWKYNAGSWVYSAYTEGGEHFFFNDPKIIQGLFSYRKGWLVYTPIMAFSMLGLLVPYKKLINIRAALILAFAVQFYVIFSWWCWYYGGSFGLRAMIDFYPIAIISFACFISFAFRKHIILKGVVIILMMALIYINMFQNYQYKNRRIHFSGMTKEAYWSIFLKHDWPKGWFESLDEPDPKAERKGDRDI